MFLQHFYYDPLFGTYISRLEINQDPSQTFNLAQDTDMEFSGAATSASIEH